MLGDLYNGLAPQHLPAFGAVLIAALLLLPVVRVIGAHAGLGSPWAVRLRDGWRVADAAERWAAVLLLTTGVLHLALPLGHASGVVLPLGFVASGALFCWLAGRAVTGGGWRALAVVLLLATLVAYVVVAARGEEPDQVGLSTGLVELAALGLALGRRRRLLGGAVLLVTSTVFGLSTWAVAIAGHADHGAGMDGVGGHHHHGGDGPLARAQAGIIMRPGATGTTAEQRRAAEDLVARVRAATARYRDVRVAVADGYRFGQSRDGYDLHFENKAHQADARIVDADAPEQLVYARRGGRAALLGVVFQMRRADERGPQFGGAATAWHTHNVCVGLLPPGIAVVTPFGTCPFLTAQVTVAEMLHVWVVDNPSGPFADAMPDWRARQVLAQA